MSAATLSAALPPPRYASTVEDAQEDEPQTSSQAVASTSSIPPYGRRRGWRPTSQADFADGGSYPECHIAQYPLEMGRKKSGTSGGALALQVDAEGNVRYDAIVQQGRREGQRVQSSHKDLVPLSQRANASNKFSDLLPDRPDQETVAECTQRTRLALEKIINAKIATAQTSHVEQTGGESSYIRYTPGQQGGQGQQRIIKMTRQAEDPLEPPRWKFKKVPKGPPSPPPPVLRSPPRKVTSQEQKEWVIPPSISNWKNNKGYTIPLDKRLAADGRGLQDVHINDGFAQFSEALVLAERHAREEVRQRSLMQQKLAAKEKANREEHLRQLAQRAREERSGIAPSATPSVVGGNEDRDRSGYAGSPSRSRDSDDSSEEDSEDEEGARERERLRAERRREREREMRLSNMGTEQRARQLMRDQNRDISEQVALGLAKPGQASGGIDSRLYDQPKVRAGFGDEDSYGDKPLLSGASAAQAIYSRPVSGRGNEDGMAEEVSRNDRFGLGSSKAFSGAEASQARSGPVQFERDEASSSAAAATKPELPPRVVNDPFAIDEFLDKAK